jgi:hypothetical protein
MNTLGTTVWLSKVRINQHQDMLSIYGLQMLPSGIYVLRVLASDGQIYTCKMQKH